jgi:hypothetical protein
LPHPLPQEFDVCPSLTLALAQLQTVDMALDRPIAPRQGEPRFDCRDILLTGWKPWTGVAPKGNAVGAQELGAAQGPSRPRATTVGERSVKIWRGHAE